MPSIQQERFAVGMNELVLIGTGFVIARVLYVWYSTPAKSTADAGNDRR